MAEVFNKQYRVYPGETAVGQSIVDVCNRRSLPYNMKYTFHVIEMPGINAFAIPGGGVYITRDFISKISQSSNPEAQLSFVFGHEVAHITQRHWISSLKKQYTAEFWQWAAAELSRKGNTEFLRQIIPPILEAVFAGYSRQHEHEADSLGMLFMARAGFNIKGAADALRMLAEDGTNGYTIWSSHPRIEDRISFAEQMKSIHEKVLENELAEVLSQCSSESGALAINIEQLSGYFPEIGTENTFEEFAILFFNVDSVTSAYKSGKELSVPLFSSASPGQYHRILPAGDYVMFYRARSMKRWFTPYRVGESGWGPLRVSVQAKSVTYVSVTPRGSSCQVYDYTWDDAPIPRSSIDYEFVQRFVLDKQTDDHFSIDFAPLPNQPPRKENIEVSGSAGILEDQGCVIMPSGGLEILTKFSIKEGTPSLARLTVNCSCKSGHAEIPAYLTIEVNGQVLVSDQVFESKNQLAYTWDISNLVVAGDNSVSLIRSTKGGSLAVHAIDIEVLGAGLGSFYAPD